jgi:sugar/nucleoside kinase (ribokinase family)
LSSPDLIVVGDCNPDLVISGDDVTPEFGQREKLVGAMTLMIGGSAAITAVAAARLGVRVALVAAVGDDPAGELMLALLAREQVDVSRVLVRPGSPTSMTTVLSAGSDRAILTSLGAMTSLTAADVPESLLAGARHLHVSSYFLLEDSLGPGLVGLLATARRHGLRTSLDPNYDPAQRWGDERLRAALRQVDVFLPNETEALRISGHQEVGSAAAALAGFCESVVIKLGARGALCCQAEGGQRSAGSRRANGGQAGQVLVSVPPAEPVDTTGAGDCFNAGLIAGLLQGLDRPEAVAIGCAVGAASTAAVGGTGAVVDLGSAYQLSARAKFTFEGV